MSSLHSNFSSNVDRSGKDWVLNEADLQAIAIGAGILGTGGGGSTYLAYLQVREQMRAGRTVRVRPLSCLTDNDCVLPLGGIGAPTVGIERMDSGDEGKSLVEAIESVSGEKVTAVIADEIGGGNGLVPMVTAAQLDLPVIDGDGMGRAFPETQMTSFFIYGQATAPAALTDACGNAMVVTHATSATQLESMMRAATITMGCSAMMSTAPMSGSFTERYAIPGTLSQSWQLGKAVLSAGSEKRDAVAAIVEQAGGTHLLTGKVVDVERRIDGGFVRGNLRIDGIDQDSGRSLMIDLQNEYLVAREENHIHAMVPDLVCIVDAESGRAIGTEEQRYGLRVAVIVLPAPALLLTPTALESVGPRAFGYEFSYSAGGSCG
jgi:DUF917 family protein